MSCLLREGRSKYQLENLFFGMEYIHWLPGDGIDELSGSTRNRPNSSVGEGENEIFCQIVNGEENQVFADLGWSDQGGQGQCDTDILSDHLFEAFDRFDLDERADTDSALRKDSVGDLPHA